MPKVRARRLVAVPADVAYDVAADVASYSKFLPLVEQSVVVGDVHEAAGVTAFNAHLAVGYKKLHLREEFVSRVVCDRSALRVSASSNDNPFRHMKTVWSITEAAGRADVAIEIDYAVRNPLLQLAIGSAMNMAIDRVMAAFETRAKAVYAAASNRS